MMDIIIQHRTSRAKTHALWKHYAGSPSHIIGKVVHLDDADFKLCEQYFNRTASRLRDRLDEVESELRDAEGRNDYLMKVIEWVAAENARLSRKIDALTYATGDNGLNDLMNLM